MCGRFTNRLTWSEIHELYSLNSRVERRNTPARYNIAPTQEVLFCRLDAEGERAMDEGRWGLVPHWAKEMPKAPLFNARSETAGEKPAFRDAFRTRRCLIPADGFYEWQKNEDGSRDPWFFHLAAGAAFSFAGLWAHNDHLGITSCTILTADATEPVTRVHDRAPVILDRGAYEEWLDPSTSPGSAQTLLSRNLAASLQMHRVGRAVNSARYEGEDAVRPVPPTPGVT